MSDYERDSRYGDDNEVLAMPMKEMSKTSDTEPIQLEVGQLWADNDPRASGRVVKIVAVVDEVKHHIHPPGRYVSTGDGAHDVIWLPSTHVLVQTAKPCSDGTWQTFGRLTKVRKDRFRPTANGYRRLEEGEVG